MLKESGLRIVFWSIAAIIVAICSFFIIHNAAWLLGDDTQTLIYTGWDKPIFGFFVTPAVGRFFPLDYTIYDILCLFYSGRIPPSAHYFIHVICFVGFVLCISLVSMHILKEEKAIWKYGISLFVVILVIGRTYANFSQCWTGIWTIFTFLSIYLLFSIRFIDNGKWKYAIIAFIAISYILYYYETVFIIPVTTGCASLILNYYKTTKKEKCYYAMLISSGVIFLLLYAILVLPKVETFYGHHSEMSIFQNGIRMLFAQKIMWLVIMLIFIRGIHYVIKPKEYHFSFYDSLLLSSVAYFTGCVILGLDYTLYYTPSVIIGIPAIIFFSKRYFRIELVFILFVALGLFYGRKIPTDIISTDKARTTTYNGIKKLISEIESEDEYGNVYFYEPENNELKDWELDVRSIRRYYLEKVTGWYKNDIDFLIEKKTSFDGEHGFWQVVSADEKSFLDKCPEAELVVDFSDSKVFMY